MILHPEYAARYRSAWIAWCQNPKLTEACHVLGMSDLEWAQRYVEQFGPITFTSNTTDPPFSFDPIIAWAEAKRPAPAGTA